MKTTQKNQEKGSKSQGSGSERKQQGSGEHRHTGQQMDQSQSDAVNQINEDRFDNTDNSKRDQTLMPSGQPDQPREGDPQGIGRR